ncbi:hypothetical protein DPMN_133614 [Dreissena polymorpha]|uniref:Uncharacterized protein n=1 Tax=Dreissena polymorpha TaxID=45954 RepID=A0A9D4FTX7_DREPO|nr:hypothetical protein DPMN_133614 [Dreissena polymorpha]
MPEYEDNNMLCGTKIPLTDVGEWKNISFRVMSAEIGLQALHYGVFLKSEFDYNPFLC